jgi:tol-pal system protein YbgF
MLGEKQAGALRGARKGGQVVRRLSFFLLLCLVASACASSSDFDALQRDINDVRRQTVDTRKEVDSLKEKTTGVVKEGSLSAMRDSQVQINSRLSEISNSLQELRGRFEEYKYSTEKALRDMVAERDLARAQIAAVESQVKALKDKLAAVEAPAAPAETPPAAAVSPAGTEKEKAEAPVSEPQKEPAAEKVTDYDAAYQLFKDKKYKEAREKFESFLKDFPKDRLAGNAQFWIAETYFAGKDYESAILAYETLLKKYPESEKASAASYKQGLAFIEIGDKKTGMTILRKLVAKYPASKDAALAKKKLAELEKKSVGKKR